MASAIDLRGDFDGRELRGLAKATRDAAQSRRLIALAEIYDGGRRSDAARIGGVGFKRSGIGCCVSMPVARRV